MANFPTSLDTFTNPTATDLLENTNDLLDHHAQHNKVNDCIRAVQGRIGKNASPATGSVEWILQNGIYRPSDLVVGGQKKIIVQDNTQLTSTDFSQDDEFTGTSLGGQWSIINSGITVTETVTLQKSWVELAMPATNVAADRNRFIVQSITNPTSNWFFGMKLNFLPDHVDSTKFIHSGIFMRASSTGKYLSWGYNRRGSAAQVLSAWVWNSTDSYVNTFGSYASPWNVQYVGIRRNSDGYHWYMISEDGISWQVLDAYTYASWVPDVDQIGFGIMVNNTTRTHKVAVDWFRRFE